MKPGDKLTVDELNVILNAEMFGYPPHELERLIIAQLDIIGRVLGYGRLHQLADLLRDVQCYGIVHRAATFKRQYFADTKKELPADFDKVAAK